MNRQIISNNMFTNFNDGYQSNPIIEKTNFKNSGHTIHNNLRDNLLIENIVDYYINIDSDDRKFETYPDPFNYVVTFNSVGRSKYKFKNESTELNETPGPVINRTFKNIKYIKLDHVILSRHNINKYTLEQNILVDTDNKNLTVQNICLNKHCHKDCNNNCYLCRSKSNCSNFCDCNCKNCSKFNKCNKCFQTSDNKNDICIGHNDNCHTCENMMCKCIINDKNKFLILKVKELVNNKMLSTNPATDKSYILHIDRTLGNFHNVWITRNGTSTYQNSTLENLNRLSIEFCNNKGDRLNIAIVIQCNIKINHICHRFILIFGKLEDDIKNNIKGIKLEFPIKEIFHTENWYKRIINILITHINDNKIKAILNLNIDTIYNSIKNLDIIDLIKCDITNNVFFIIGTYQNELGTDINY